MSDITLHTEDGEVILEANLITRIINTSTVTCTVILQDESMVYVRAPFYDTLDEIQRCADD